MKVLKINAKKKPSPCQEENSAGAINGNGLFDG